MPKCPLTDQECNCLKTFLISEDDKNDASIIALCDNCIDYYILSDATVREIKEVRKFIENKLQKLKESNRPIF